VEWIFEPGIYQALANHVKRNLTVANSAKVPTLNNHRWSFLTCETERSGEQRIFSFLRQALRREFFLDFKPKRRFNTPVTG
jgi:hypothetical protein